MLWLFSGGGGIKLLGAPNERIWPSLLDLPNVRSGKIDVLGVSHRYNPLGVLFPHFRKEGMDFFKERFTYDPDKRFSARQALRHQYFLNKPLPKSKDVMPTFPTRHGPEPAKLKMSSKGQQASSSSSWVMGASKSKSSSNSASGSGRRGGGLLPTAGGEGRPAAVATRTSASSSSAAGAAAAAASGSSGGANVGSSSATAAGGARREDAEELREGDGEGTSSSRRAVGGGGSEGSVPLKKPRR
ncbi:cdk10/11, putative [Ectocarpus siliculosus]|uniref:Cdk10/11, putative n=1 Tax=Ectocarpus siliculosus TaxID=2880 RepID=D8LCI7_ECTSI|nr:cdk10/11, putative [Ectocarpus siliculosus]|eukprot:CBN79500.1 cdk10/11, putative [Ectocarpus siliculosus]